MLEYEDYYNKITKSLSLLVEANSLYTSSAENDDAKSALIRRFAIAFDAVCSALHNILISQGFSPLDFGSPGCIFVLAQRSGLITDEQIWQDMLRVRCVAFRFDLDFSDLVAKTIHERFVIALFSLKNQLAKHIA